MEHCKGVFITMDNSNFKVFFEIDKNGFYLRDVILEINHKTGIFEADENLLQVRPIGFFKPKWDGEKWVEGKTEEEFLEEGFLNAINPTPEEIAKAERELEVIELLLEMGLI